jgi:peptidyl-prolyl cis-trans isomerase B (cyclophilin B)
LRFVQIGKGDVSKMKTSVCILFALAVLFALPAVAQDEGSGPKGSAAKSEARSATGEMKSEGSAAAKKEGSEAKEGEYILLRTTKGPIVIDLFEDDAPEHAKSFRSLVKKGFYDGTYFHRLIEGFVVQGGDPNTKDDNEMNDGMGGPGYTVPNESTSARKHLRGSVAAARTADPDSAGSQFYIALKALPQLDQMKYTVFGEVVYGMDTVDKIVKVEKKSLRPRGEPSYPVEKTHIEKASLITAEELGKMKKG